MSHNQIMEQSENDILGTTFGWFQTAVPSPTPKNVHTQLGVHFEEVSELVQELVGLTPETETLLAQAKAALTALGDHLKANDAVITITNRVGVLDALADQAVTLTGSAYMLNMNITGALAEVNRSNYSKFDENGNAIFNENKKVIKGPNYTAPDLLPYV